MEKFEIFGELSARFSLPEVIEVLCLTNFSLNDSTHNAQFQMCALGRKGGRRRSIVNNISISSLNLYSNTIVDSFTAFMSIYTTAGRPKFIDWGTLIN
jgi:hypothetical protein